MTQLVLLFKFLILSRTTCKFEWEFPGVIVWTGATESVLGWARFWTVGGPHGVRWAIFSAADPGDAGWRTVTRRGDMQQRPARRQTYFGRAAHTDRRDRLLRERLSRHRRAGWSTTDMCATAPVHLLIARIWVGTIGWHTWPAPCWA